MRVGARLNPTSYVVDGMRQMVFENGAALPGDESLPLWLCFAVIAAFASLAMLLAYTAFRRSIR